MVVCIVARIFCLKLRMNFYFVLLPLGESQSFAFLFNPVIFIVFCNGFTSRASHAVTLLPFPVSFQTFSLRFVYHNFSSKQNFFAELNMNEMQ